MFSKFYDSELERFFMNKYMWKLSPKNIAAAKNILSRLTDEEITLYTPYKRVKEILDSRIKEA